MLENGLLKIPFKPDNASLVPPAIESVRSAALRFIAGSWFIAGPLYLFCNVAVVIRAVSIDMYLNILINRRFLLSEINFRGAEKYTLRLNILVLLLQRFGFLMGYVLVRIKREYSVNL